MNQILRTIGKFWFPALCIIVALVLLISGFTGDQATRQNNLALFGTLAILLIGIVSVFFLLDMLKKSVVWGLTGVFIVGSVYFAYNNVKTIDSELKLTAKRNLVKAQMIQRLKDVRTAELAYLEMNGVYTKNWSELKNFIKSGKMMTVKDIGELPDSILNESQAIELGLYQSRPAGMTDQQIKDAGLLVKDTIYENALKVLFENEKAMAKRKYPLNLDQFDIAPGTNNERLILNAGSIDVSGGAKRPVFVCEDPKPFDKSVEALKVGSMTEAITNGNWKE
ncbi:MAG: hypothetical protein ACI8XB_000056 [Patiriisocius sp.]|jgi:hypothetical protein